ncbi:hypothetical protein BDK51DRAFT_29430 [Blyttiomyces helicus]|uniref:Uncharacterized protein n=1 Tax=Blyttiomyces helicus TaxID=388810 RepID=A0A4P9W6Q2_9FUNG|nr:hypothetical protein BDK51DRAFT_29430 [Blyttiomyces helicus]|eukprot:RKO85806.1 hypothetical protein BDK51DRAFT_29430 [Blyttiomyces helicus]
MTRTGSSVEPASQHKKPAAEPPKATTSQPNELAAPPKLQKALYGQIESIEVLAIDIPKIYEDLAHYIARLITAGTLDLAEVHALCAPLLASPAPHPPAVKLLGEIYVSVQESEGAAALKTLHKEQSDAVWKTFWPVGKAFDDVCAEWTEQCKVTGICPRLVFIKELRSKLLNENTEAVGTWVLSCTDESARSSPGFPRIIATSVFRTVAVNTVFANGVDRPVESSTELIKRQRDLLAGLKPFLLRFATRAAYAQVQILLAAQNFSAEIGFPQGELEHFFVPRIAPFPHEALADASAEDAATKATALAAVKSWLKEIKA